MDFSTYFQSSKNYFWQWEEKGKVIAIPNDQTIAYIGLVQDVLEVIHEQGLPPFGALILATIATNPNGKTGIETVRKIMVEHGAFSAEVADAVEFLQLLSDLPADYKTGEKKILLFQAIFERCHHIISIKRSYSIYKAFASRDQPYFPEFYNSKAFNDPQDFNRDVVYRDFRTLQIMNNKFKSAQDILDKMAGMKKMPEEIVLEETETLQDVSTDLVEQLVENSKTFHVGSLVKRIWSGLNIPVHSTIPSQQPIGGISDLTNKGDFDKLLISEFANDDMVFMSRLANNEALYIHREIPPSNNDLKRVILIDATLKNWGTPKTIAFATMLAIARHPKTNIECEAFVIGNTHHPVAIENIHGIINGLEILEGSLNAANGLESFFTEFPPNANREIFLITEPSTLKQSAMLKMVNEYQAAINYWIYTDAEGNINVYKKQQNSKKHLQHLRLPLRELWNKTPQNPVESKRNATTHDSLYPILVKVPNDAKAVLSTQNGDIYQVTGQKTLLKLYDRGQEQKDWEKACEVIYENLPFVSQYAEIGILKNGDCVFVMYSPNAKSIFFLNVTQKTSQTLLMSKWKPVYDQGFIFRDDKFHYQAFGLQSFSIDAAGFREDTNSELDPKLFHARKQELAELKKNFYVYSSGSTLKKIKNVFINQRNYLVLNSHELWVNQNDQLQLQPNGFLQEKKRATQYSKGEFRFEDGSTISIARAGILILRSSNPDLPEIFLPSEVGRPLGVVAGDHASGSTYHLKNESEPMAIHDFYVNYIATFIRTILNHGT